MVDEPAFAPEHTRGASQFTFRFALHPQSRQQRADLCRILIPCGLENPFQAVRYHSLAVDKTTLPECLIPTASSEDGELMGIRHRTRLIEGIQYHPESVLTQSGKRQLRNFIRMVKKYREAHAGEFASC